MYTIIVRKCEFLKSAKRSYMRDESETLPPLLFTWTATRSSPDARVHYHPTRFPDSRGAPSTVYRHPTVHDTQAAIKTVHFLTGRGVK
jgi:hypothetical protein